MNCKIDSQIAIIVYRTREGFSCGNGRFNLEKLVAVDTARSLSSWGCFSLEQAPSVSLGSPMAIGRLVNNRCYIRF